MNDQTECTCPEPEPAPPGAVVMPGKWHQADCPTVAWIRQAADVVDTGANWSRGGFRPSPGEEEARQALDAIRALTERVERLEQNLVGLSDVIVTLSEAVDQLAKYLTEETGA